MGIKTPDVPVGTVMYSWTVLEHLKSAKEMKYRCKCACGTERIVTKSNLRLGKTKSCNTGDCHVSSSVTHGLTDHPLYSVWSGIRKRLSNPTGANECYQGIKLAKE